MTNQPIIDQPTIDQPTIEQSIINQLDNDTRTIEQPTVQRQITDLHGNRSSAPNGASHNPLQRIDIRLSDVEETATSEEHPALMES